MKRIANWTLLKSLFVAFTLVLSVPALTKAATPKAEMISEKQLLPGAKQEGNVTWWFVGSSEDATAAIAEFNKKYPFIKVTAWSGDSKAIAAKMWAEYQAGRHNWDVSYGSEDSLFPRYRKAGLLAKFSTPDIEKLPSHAKEAVGDAVQWGGMVVVPAYNTNLVSAAEAPKSWQDLLDPKWSGKIALTDWMVPWVTMAMKSGKEEVKSYITKLAANKPQMIRGHTSLVEQLSAGAFKVAAEVFLYSINQYKDKGAPVEWIKAQPVIFTGPFMILSANAPHPNAARLFISWCFSQEGQQAWDRISGKGSPFPGTGTRQSRLVEGLDYIMKDTKYLAESLGYQKELQRILGVIR